MAKKRQQRSNYNGQEEMCSALWEFAAEVIALDGKHSFVDREHHMTKGQSDAIDKAMERISKGYGYRLLEIQ